MPPSASAQPAPAPAPPRAATVQVRDVHRRFGTQEVLKGVSFEVAPQEIFVLMGPSGAGKSVLLRHIIGLDTPDSGKILINGKDAADRQTHRDIVTAIVFQTGALFNSMTVFDNLAFYPREHRLYDRKTIREKTARTLEILSLTDAARKRPAELSGGMRKRVAIAQALMMEPQLLLYDEPTSELDPVSAANISEIIGTLRDEMNVTSIVVSHDRELSLSIADRVGMLFDGELAAVAPPAEIRQLPSARIQDFLHPKIDTRNPRFRNQENQPST